MTNILFCWGEEIRQFSSQTKEKGITQGFFTSLFTGPVFIVRRALVGAYEIVTFPFPPYRAVLQPEFVFNDVGRLPG